MMSKIRGCFTWLLTAALCLSLLVPPPAAAATLYLTAINESLAPLTASTIPFWSGGVLYVPHTVFDTNTTGGGLDLHTNYSRNNNTVTLFTLRQMLVYDLTEGTCRDGITNEAYQSEAPILRNGQPFLPLEAVCKFFDLTFTYTSIRQGHLIRIKNDAAVLSDAKFIDAASDLIDRRVREYNQSVGSSSSAATTPTPTEENVSSTDVRTYLAFRCQTGESISSLANTLDQNQVFGLFLLTPQLLEEEGDLVRRLLGTGHSVGILAEGNTLAETRTLLESGRRCLEQTVLLRTTIACVPADQRKTIETEGWVCWTETYSLNPSATIGPNTFAANTLERLQRRTRDTYLTLAGDDNALRILPVLLRQLRQNHFVVSIPMETRL